MRQFRPIKELLIVQLRPIIEFPKIVDLAITEAPIVDPLSIIDWVIFVMSVIWSSITKPRVLMTASFDKSRFRYTSTDRLIPGISRPSVNKISMKLHAIEQIFQPA